MEVDIARNKGDQRPESHRVLSTSEIKLLHEVSTDREWEERRKLVLGNQKIYTNLKEIIGLAHDNKVSLVVFKPPRSWDSSPRRPSPNGRTKKSLAF